MFNFVCVLAFVVENLTPKSTNRKKHLLVAFPGSIYSITATWIEVNMLRYICEYQPPFTSKQVHTGDLKQVRYYTGLPTLTH